MANLRIKDQYTNLTISNGRINTTTDEPTEYLKVGDSVSQVGVKNGALCLNESLPFAFRAGIRDKFTVPIADNRVCIDQQAFIDSIEGDYLLNIQETQFLLKEDIFRILLESGDRITL